MPQVLTYSIIYGAIGLGLAAVLWPTASSGQALLERWGVEHPTVEQGGQVAGYLRAQRLMIPPLFALGPVIAYFGSDIVRAMAPLVSAMLLAEVLTAAGPVRGPRTAVLARRHWYDLVPRWAVAAFVGTAGLVVVLAVIALLGGAVSWGFIAGAFVVLVGVLGAVWLCVRRRSVGDSQVDAVWRTRNARGAVGAGITWMATLVLAVANQLSILRSVDGHAGWLDATVVTDFIGPPVFLGAVFVWIWIGRPTRRMPYVRAAA